MENQKSFYSALFIISAVVTAMQILQSRIFSVTTWYHLSFTVISIAMFGLTLGALKVYRGNEEEQRRDIHRLAGNAALMCGVCLLFSLIVQMRMPLIFSDFLWTLIVLPVSAVITGLPYYFSGIVLCICLTRTSLPVSRVYGIDLLGAASGCILALALMNLIDTPSGALLLVSAAGGAALLFKSAKGMKPLDRQAALLLMMITVVFALINTLLPRPILYPLWVKAGIAPERLLDYDAWNAISRVTMGQEKKDVTPMLWGASPKLPAFYKSTYKSLAIDGDAGTVITKFDGHSWPSVGYLDYDVTNLAYHLPDIKRAAIIGVGGGRDLLSAKYFHVQDVTAMDINNVQISLLAKNKTYRDYANLYNQPGVTLVNSEARSWFRRNKEPFDLIQMSLIDTWAATGAGSFSLSENGLYTLEAWSTFIANLTDRGVFTVSRWYLPGVEGEASRQIGLAVAALLQNGIKDPRDHVFMAASNYIATIIVSRPPLDTKKLEILRDQARAKKFTVLVSPDMKPHDTTLDHFLSAKTVAELNAYASTLPMDMAPPTDMRPFFFNQVRFTKPLLMLKLAFLSTSGTFAGHAKATFNLFIIIGFAFLMTLLTILFPLWSDVKNQSSDFLISGTSYFLLIGLGFMMIEISLLQGFGVFLGHPVYGLSVVLFSLILSTGLGSLASGCLPLRTPAAYITWCLTVVLLVTILSCCLGGIFNYFGTASLPERSALSVLIIVPLGILLGYGFPTGMHLTAAIDSRATAWLYGVNGAAGVLSSALAIAFNIGMGIDRTLLLASICYLLLIPFTLKLHRMQKT